MILIMISRILFLIFVVSMIQCSPLVLDFSVEQIKLDTITYRKGDVVKPFEAFNFDEGQWIAYLFISHSDQQDLSKEMPQGRKFKTTDRILLKEMQENWKFIYTDGDVATLESELILYHNGKLVFRSGILLNEKRQGLQNRQYGWLEATPRCILSRYCKKLKKVRWPIILK